MNAPAPTVVPATSDDRASCLDNEVSALRALLANHPLPELTTGAIDSMMLAADAADCSSGLGQD